LAVSRRLRDENWGRFTQPGEDRDFASAPHRTTAEIKDLFHFWFILLTGLHGKIEVEESLRPETP
jgi:hypothetical protein